MRITESLPIENDRGGYQELCSDCEACMIIRRLTVLHCLCIMGGGTEAEILFLK